MSGVTMGSLGLRPTNVTTPKELCDLLGGSRVINKVRFFLKNMFNRLKSNFFLDPYCK